MKWLTDEEARDLGLDAYGIIDEGCFSLKYPRPVYETAPTLGGALEAATDMLRYSTDSVSVCRVRYQQYGESISPFATDRSVQLDTIGNFEDLEEDE